MTPHSDHRRPDLRLSPSSSARPCTARTKCCTRSLPRASGTGSLVRQARGGLAMQQHDWAAVGTCMTRKQVLCSTQRTLDAVDLLACFPSEQLGILFLVEFRVIGASLAAAKPSRRYMSMRAVDFMEGSSKRYSMHVPSGSRTVWRWTHFLWSIPRCLLGVQMIIVQMPCLHIYGLSPPRCSAGWVLDEPTTICRLFTTTSMSCNCDPCYKARYVATGYSQVP